MAGSFQISGSNIIVTFTYQAAAQKVQDTIGDAGEYLWKQGVRAPSTPAVSTYDELTNQQKLDIVDFHIRQDILNKAKALYVTQAMDMASETAETEVQDRYL